MRDALAIYITLLLIVAVAIAQLLYWRLVITREDVAGDRIPDLPDMDWLHERVDAWAALAADEPEPGLVDAPVLVGV